MGLQNTIFGQMLQFISRNDFEKAVKWYKADNRPLRLSRIRVRDPKTGKYVALLTNQMNWSPKTGR